MALCLCGCSNPTLSGNRFISGHNLRVLVKDSKHKKLIGEAVRRAWEVRRLKIGNKRIKGGREQAVRATPSGRLSWYYVENRSSSALTRREKYGNLSEDELDKLPNHIRYQLKKNGFAIHHHWGRHIKGKKFSVEHRKKIGDSHRKYLFDARAVSRDGKMRLRKSIQYQEWRTAVFQRDNYTCRDCGAKSGNGVAVVLEAHHIRSFTKFVNLRFELSNGKTLCISCHRAVEKRRRARRRT